MSSWVLLLVQITGMAVVFAAVIIWKFFAARERKRSPLTRGLLRGPGYSLQEKIDEVTFDFAGMMGISTMIPFMFYAAYLNEWVRKGAQPTGFFTTFVLVLAIAGLIMVAWRIVRLLNKRRQLRLGFEAELAAGQELNQLAHDGYWVFHDFPADTFNIDHVVVGPTGVYAVETKGRPKRHTHGEEKGYEVRYDGKRLEFPGWSEAEPLEQAERQANWLRKWLARAVGEQVPVKPMLLLPGWFVRRTGGGGIPVFSGKEVRTYLPKVGAGTLSPIQIQRIVHQLDQKCRSIEAKAYSKENGRRGTA